MGKPYSLDLRKRVVAAIEGGMSRNQAAKQFGVAISTAIGWMKRVDETGSVAPGQMGGHKPKAVSGDHAVWLSRRILWFGPMLQSLHIALILLASQAAVLFVRLAAGDAFPGWPIFVAPLIAAALWPVVTWLLLLRQRRPANEQAI